MSKSLGNYIGITEPPEVMFRKVMQISDELMFRYYELLTDRSVAEIASMKQSIAAATLHPMEAKMALGRLIVADFHSAEAATAAQDEFTRVVRHRQVPSEIETVPLPDGVEAGQGIRVDKLLARLGLAESVSDAARKIKAGAVKINDAAVAGIVLTSPPPELLIQVGKHWRRVTEPPPGSPVSARRRKVRT